ncbi:MAG: hypothetical protein BGO31_16060 [Bacteroidetes bacterium 43-16]|nr:MAG: hypothetical protein BGO31_16060 [Bacteroidetes bacterium 43-16]
MKCYLGLAAIVIALGFGSCAKLSDCQAVDAKCLQKPPVNEACQAAFSRWFYDAESNQCTLVPYTGCSDVGFKSEAECNACACKK